MHMGQLLRMGLPRLLLKARREDMGKKLNYRRTFFIGLAFLSISAFWQMYDNIIPLILQNTFHLGEDRKSVV